MVTITRMPGGNDSGNGPGRPRKATAEAVYRAFDEVRGPATTAAELGRVLDVSSKTAIRRLHDLEADDRVVSKKVGANTRIWWRTDDSTQ